MPTVSVIMAAYNHESFVEAAVHSVLDQTYSDLELIVVDDASPDATADRVQGISDTRIKLFKLEKNRQVHPRNLAIQHAKGRYVAFQNSDDLWAPDKLAKQVAVMDENPEISACFTGVKVIDEKSAELIDNKANPFFNPTTNWVLSRDERSQAAWLRHFFYQGNCLALPSAMVRRNDLIYLSGFRGSLIQLGDFDLWIRLAFLGQFVYLTEPLTHFRIIPGKNLSTSVDGRGRRTKLEWASILNRFIEEPIMSWFGKIFPELSKFNTVGGRKVVFVATALNNKIPGAVIFADRTLEQVLDNPQQWQEATRECGGQFVRDFFSLRTKLSFTVFTKK